MKKICFLVIFTVCLQSRVYAKVNEYISYSECAGIESRNDFYMNVTNKNVYYKGEKYIVSTFQFANITYVSLREFSKILNMSLTYDIKSHNVVISDEFSNQKNEIKLDDERVYKAERNLIPIYYKNKSIGLQFDDGIGYSMVIPQSFNVEDKIYIELKEISKNFNFICDESENEITINEKSGKLNRVYDDKYVGYKSTTEELNISDTRIDNSLVEEALMIQKSIYSGPEEIIGQKVQKLLYNGKPCIYITTSVKTWLSGDSWSYTGLYEVIY